jgi:hypothetical protein
MIIVLKSCIALHFVVAQEKFVHKELIRAVTNNIFLHYMYNSKCKKKLAGERTWDLLVLPSHCGSSQKQNI